MYRKHLIWGLNLSLTLLFFNSLQAQNIENPLLSDTLHVPWFEIYRTDEEIRDLAIGPSGALWIASKRGVVRFHGTVVQQRFDRTHGLPHEETSKILSTEQYIIAATKGGIVFFEDVPYPDSAQISKDILFKGYNCASIFLEKKKKSLHLWSVLLKLTEDPSIGHILLNVNNRDNPIKPFGVKDIEVRELLPAGADTLILRGTTYDWYYYNVKTGGVGEYRVPVSEPISGYTYKDTTWILGQNSLWRHTASADTIVSLIPGTQQGRIVQGIRKAYAWRAQGKELYITDLQSLKVRRIIQLPEECIPIDVAEDFRRRLWVATSSRLFMCDFLGTELLHFPRQDLIMNPPSDSSIVFSIPLRTKTLSDKISSVKRSKSKLAGFASNGNIWMASDKLLGLKKTNLDSIIVYKTNEVIQDVHIEKSPYISTGKKFFQWKSKRWNQLTAINEQRLNNLEKTDKLLNYLYGVPQIFSKLQEKFSQEELSILESRNNLLTVLKQEFSDSILFNLPDTSAPMHLLKLFHDNILLIGYENIQPRNAIGWITISSDGKLIRGRDPTTIPYLKDLTVIIGDSAICFQPSLLSNIESFYLTTSISQTGQLSVLDRNGILVTVTKDLSSNIFEWPWRNNLQRDRYFLPLSIDIMNSNNASTQVFFMSNNKIWRKRQNASIDTVLNLNVSRGGIIAGLLPLPEGDRFLVGCWDFGDENLYSVSIGGSVIPEALGAKKIGCWNNAMLIDSRGRIWVSSADEGLFRTDINHKHYEPVLNANRDTLNVHVNDMLEFPKGKAIWLACGGTGSKGVWKIDYGKAPAQVWNTSENTIRALSLYPEISSESPLIWAGGTRELFAIDPNSLEHIDYYTKLQEHTGSSNIQINDMKTAGDILYIMTDVGLIGFDSKRFRKINLPDLTNSTTISEGKILVRTNGEIVALISDQRKRESYLWKRLHSGTVFTRIATIPSKIYTLVELASHKVIMGGDSGRIYILRNQQPELLIDLTEHTLKTPLRSITSLDTNGIFVLGRGSHLFHFNSTAGTQRRLNTVVKPWTKSEVISNSRIMLQHEENISILNLDKGQDASIDSLLSKEKIYKFAHQRDQLGHFLPDTTWLLGEKYIWRLSFSNADSEQLDSIVAIPSKIRGISSQLQLLVNRGGIWLATPGLGLWWHPFTVNKANLQDEASDSTENIQVNWHVWDIHKGLPSDNIIAIEPINDVEFIVVTPLHFFLSRYDKLQNELSFKFPNLGGIKGTPIHTATVFSLKNRIVVAAATEQGISLACLPDSTDRHNDEKVRWTYLDREGGLLDNTVSALFSESTQNEFWVGTDQGITIHRFDFSDNGLLVPSLVGNITKLQNLPAGKVLEIRATTSNAWILTQQDISGMKMSYTMSRYDRNQKKVTINVPIPYSREIKMGPALPGKAPQLLLTDTEGNWSLWRPDQYIAPEIKPIELYFFSTASVKLNSLDPLSEDPKNWQIQYTVDRLDHSLSSWPLFIPPDLWPDGRPHYIMAKIRRKQAAGNGPAPEYWVSRKIESTKGYRWIRLIIISFLLMGIIGLIGWEIWRKHVRNARLRRKEIPYISGEAIQKPEQFIGREDLLVFLRDTIHSTNYALVGEFRIGKTSIQHQFNRLIKSINDKNYVFLPAFLDLQHLGGKEAQFFYFFGSHLMTLAQENEVDPETINQLFHVNCTVPEDYDSIAFRDDLNTLLEYWSQQYAPRKPLVVFQIDEINLLVNFDYNTLLMFRALMVHQPLFKTVLSGITLFKNRDRDALSPWWNLYREIPIEPLTSVEARKLITEPVKGLFHYDDVVIDRIHAHARGRPLQIQDLCTNILRYKYRKRIIRRRITLEDFQNSLEARKQDT